jgi:hypothetical protein
MESVRKILAENSPLSSLVLACSVVPLAAAPSPPVLGFINAGRTATLVLLLILFILGYLFVNQAQKGRKFPIRTIAGFEAIKEAVGRAVETGRPVHYTFAYGNLYGGYAPQFMAALGVLSHVSKVAGQYGARLITTHGVPEAIPMVEELMREGYRSAGKADMYRVEDVRYLTDQQFAFASAVQAAILREKIAANIMLGPFAAEALIFAETGVNVGAIQIAGTARETQIPFFVLVCDYVLIAEEMFAASALATGDMTTAASLGAEDVGKIIAIALIILGIAALLLSVNVGALLSI